MTKERDHSGMRETTWADCGLRPLHWIWPKDQVNQGIGTGRAIVATSVPSQLIDNILRDCVWVTDQPEGFPAAILNRASDEHACIDILRGERLDTLHLTHEICYGELQRNVANRIGQ
jgi:hypothetical protein